MIRRHIVTTGRLKLLIRMWVLAEYFYSNEREKKWAFIVAVDIVRTSVTMSTKAFVRYQISVEYRPRRGGLSAL